MSIEKDLIDRKRYLSKLIEKTEKKLKRAPKGTLRIACSRNRVQYYCHEEPSDRRGRYIPKEEIKLIRSLAQKSYEKKLVKASEEEIKAIDAYLRLTPDCKADELYGNLPETRRALVTPVTETDEMFRKRWDDLEFAGNPYDYVSRDFISDNGETVRSKSELIIANMLEKEGVSYRYEAPLYLDGTGTVYPDFTVLNLRLRKELYWEHLGMMDDAEYAEKAIRKIAAYCQNGFFPGDSLILTFETKMVPLNIQQIRSFISKYCL